MAKQNKKSDGKTAKFVLKYIIHKEYMVMCDDPIHHNPEAAINNFHERKKLRSIANIILHLNANFSVSLCHGQLDLH